MKLLLLIIVLLLSTTTYSQKVHHIWSKYHGPRKVEYFKLGDTINTRDGILIVTRPRHLNKQIAYVEQGFYKNPSMKLVKRIFMRNCRVVEEGGCVMVE